MPVTLTYPGVYIEEIPSGVRTITGVATSITAFIGRAKRGPDNEPVVINNYGDYEREFGGLWLESTMSYAVRDYYLNGGSQAVIVRLHNGAVAAQLRLPTGEAEPDDELRLVAASKGSWGNNLSATVDYKTKDEDKPLAERDPDLFNLFVSESGGAAEKFLNVSINSDSPRYLPGVLEKESMLVRVYKNASDEYEMPGTRPSETTGTVTPLSPPASPPMSPLVLDTAGSDGSEIDMTQFSGGSLQTNKEGLYSLEKVDLFNLLCIPPYTFEDDLDSDLIDEAVKYCKDRRAMMLVDAPADWTSKASAITGVETLCTRSNYAAVFFPRLKQANPLRDNQVETFAPCGAVAGVFARTDAARGVWKAPAGQDARLIGVPQLSVPLTDAENGELNPLAINCLRSFPVYGRLVWGSRTLDGADKLASEWKYIPVRRMALYIEESLYRGTQWVVFEPNDEPLWAQIRLNVGAFMHNLFRQGAFQGTAPKDAYLVKCDKETTTQNDINQGIVNILVGFAPLKPAEFVVIKIQQLAGQVEA